MQLDDGQAGLQLGSKMSGLPTGCGVSTLVEALWGHLGARVAVGATYRALRLQAVGVGADTCATQVIEGYHTLQLVHFFTCGPDEVRAWTIRDGWKAPQAAGTIHTDFERGFIKAEVYAYTDWEAGEYQVTKVKEAGKYRTEGKEYFVKDGDVHGRPSSASLQYQLAC